MGPHRDPSGARLGARVGRCGDRRFSAVRHLHERVSGGELDLRAAPCCRSPWLGIFVAFGALFLRLNGIAFGEPRGPPQVKASYLPMFAHLALVFAAGVYLPPRSSPGFKPWRGCWMREDDDAVEIAKGATGQGASPLPRVTVTADGWRRAVTELVEARATLLGLWGDKGCVHMAVIEEPAAKIVVLTLPCPEGKFPSVGALHPPAIRLERAINDLYGLSRPARPTRGLGSISASGA